MLCKLANSICRCVIVSSSMVVGSVFFVSFTVAAEAQEYIFDIPAQTLDETLRDYGIQADQQIVFSKGLVDGFNSSGLTGLYTAEEALSRVLDDSSLVFTRTDSGVLVVSQATTSETAVRRSERNGVSSPNEALLDSDPARDVDTQNGSEGTQEPQAVDENNTSALMLEEIVVTAQKVARNLQDTAVSVTVVSGEQLAKTGIIDPAALQGLIPGVQLQPISDVQITIRGLGTFNLQPGVDPAVAYSIDGTYLAYSAAMPSMLLDIAQLEAIRGPQGTLFGRNSNAGALSIVTNKPEFEFGASAALSVGNYDLFGSELVVNVPLTENVAVRAAFASQDHDPYKTGGTDDADNFTGRFRLLFEPNDDFNFLATVDYSKQDVFGVGVASACPPNSSAACSGISWQPFSGELTPNPDDFRNVENVGVYAEFNWNTDWGTLTSLTSFRHVNQADLRTGTNPNGSRFIFNPSNVDELFTQEFRLASPESSNIEWVVGLYNSDESRVDITNHTFELGNGLVLARRRYDLGDYSATSAAVFGQITMPVSERFSLIGGLRYTDEKKKAKGTATDLLAGIILPTGSNDNNSKLTWKAGVEFNAVDNILIYANASTGFKSGGISIIPPNLGLPITYDIEEITSYQVGIKSRFLNGQIQLNGEIFHYDYKGFQNLTSTTLGGILFFYTVNSQKTAFQGGELEANFLLTEVDRIDLSLAILDAEFDEFVAAGSNFSGNKVTNAPHYTFSASYEHIFLFPNIRGELSAGLRTILTGKQWMNITNQPNSLQESYTMTSVNLTYEAPNDNWSITAWGQNLENEGVLFRTFGDDGYVQNPRTFGLTARLNF